MSGGEDCYSEYVEHAIEEENKRKEKFDENARRTSETMGTSRDNG